ncbi:MAG TPA: cupredoxin domain-containing protein [Phenylobacterium sp.]|uniref:cupredoxin domain-containing protein n=1 Tax=Phenylobacterium sp. TaxID=1871053 RepID=UPI002CCFEEDA|nr:cupredoxin domain-containing protein [Phenylobacterium sp.]HSV04799.1 cupredoxin domain-containing protein [Phenylobacterium sp.]
MIPRLTVLALFAAFALAGAAAADDGRPVTVALTLKDHRFTPDRVSVPAGQPIRIELVNQDAASEEFDSDDLRVEKDVTPHGRASFTVGPLKPGTYAFMGELHADTASGEIVAVGP